VKHHLNELQLQMKQSKDFEEQMRLMKEIKDLQEIRNVLARKLGNDIIV
jgi:DNA primase